MSWSNAYKTLNVDSHRVFVAVPGPVEGILLRKTETPQIAHGGFEPNIVCIVSLAILSYSLRSTLVAPALPIPQCNMALAVKVLDLPPTVGIAHQISRVMFTEYRQGLLELVLFDIAVGCKVTAGGASGDKIFAGQQG
jgi:hypothetical protein